MRHAAIALMPLVLAAQDLRFHILPANGTPPTGRVDGVIVHDPATRQIFLFGGRDNGFRNDLWAYSLDRAQWRQLRPSGGPPPARFGHTVILDPRRHRLILFGGQAGAFFSDIWGYDIDGNSWQQLARDDAGPSRRYGHSAVLDSARDRMIISHGFTDAGRFDDTWAFDLARGAWRNISPPNGRPLRRCLHHAVMDDEGGQMLLYGGCASGFGPCPLGDLWSFDVNTNRWTERTAAAKPPARQWYGVTFDPARRAMVLFGGSGERGLLNDAWEYRPASGAWTALAVPEPAASRERALGAWVPELGPVFFGGSTDRGDSNEILVLAPAIVNAFSGRPGARSAGELISIFARDLAPGAAIRVTANDIDAPVLGAGPGRIDLQVPYELAGRAEAAFQVTVDGVTRAPATLPLADATPGVSGDVRVDEDGAWILLVTGFGAVDDAGRTAVPLAVWTGDQQAEIVATRLVPGKAGVLELRARVAEGVALGAAVSVTVRGN